MLLDANILLRLGDRGSAQHGEALAALDWLDAHAVECALVPQVLYEYWVVATRPADKNGLGLTVVAAEAALTHWRAAFRLLRDERGIFERWRDLISAFDVKGKLAHDARLVAAMQRHGLTDILTFNKPDFSRFTGIRVFTPADVLAGLLPV